MTQSPKLVKVLDLLEAIRDGRKHTRSNKVIAPLCTADLVTVVEHYPGSMSAKVVKLTIGGENYLKTYRPIKVAV